MKRQLITLFSIVIFSFTLALTGFSQSQTNRWSGGEFIQQFRSGGLADESDSIFSMGNPADSPFILINDSSFLKHITEFKYLILRITAREESSAVLRFDFFTSTDNPEGKSVNPDLYMNVGVLPEIESYVILPLSYLDAQEVFLPKFPRQLKGVVSGKRTDPGDLTALRIYTRPLSQEIDLTEVFFANDLPDFSGLRKGILVDEYGQWAGNAWKTKVNSREDFEQYSAQLQAEALQVSSFNPEWSEFGGWKALRFDSTGFFHTHNDGQRWWLVDPHGYAFLSYGMDCVRDRSEGVLEGSHDLFEWIPDRSGIFSTAFSEVREMEMIDFFRINMIRILGEDYYENWAKITANKLKSAGFNTIGNWSDNGLSEKTGIPWVMQLKDFPSTQVMLYRDFPDVFSPEYRMKARIFASQLSPVREDPLLIGYFLRNEPEWAFGNQDPALAMFGKKENSFTRMRFARWLEEKYDTIANLNRSWQLGLNDFSGIHELSLKDYPSEESKKDFREFSELMVAEYVNVICRETGKTDPNHLNLGMRYAWIASELLLKSGDAFDVYSLNGYNYPYPPETSFIFEQTGKPVIIGEFHFGSLDAGLPSTGLKAVKNQKNRAKAYRFYIENGFSRPEVIGIHYFQWMDQPVQGRFDGENYNIGFNDILFRSYPELFEEAKTSHENSYRIAAGLLKPAKNQAREAQVISF